MSIATLATSAKAFAAARPVAAAAIAVGTGVALAGGIYGGVRLARYYKARNAVAALTAPVVTDAAANDTPTVEGEVA